MNSYNEALNSAISEYKQAYISPLQSYRNTPAPPDNLVDLLSYQKAVDAKLQQVSSVRIQPCKFDPAEQVRKDFANRKQEQEHLRQSLISSAEARKSQMEAEHQKHIAEVHQYNESLTHPMRDKHNELLQYKDELSYVFKHYDITPLDIDISDKITIDEFGTLIDESLATCKKYVKKDDNLFRKAVQPLKGETNLTFTLSYVAIFAIIFYFTLPFLSLIAFPVLFMSVYSMYKDKEKLQIASALMSQIDYNRFVPEDKLQTVRDLDTTGVDTELNQQLDALPDIDKEEMSAVTEVTTNIGEIQKLLEQAHADVAAEYAAVIEELRKCSNAAKEKIESAMKDYKPFPIASNNSVVMNHKYVLGRIENRLDVTFELPARNIVFDSTNRESAISMMKLYLANALLSVRVKQLTIEIYDPKNMCADFSEFFTQDTKPYIKPNNDTLDNLVKTYRKYSQDNIIMLDHKTIDAYNEDAEKRELVPKEYKLLIILSEFSGFKDEKNETGRLFREWFQFSCESGCMVWLLDNQKYPNTIWVDGSYGMKGTPIQYTPELGKQAVATFTTALANYKDRGIDYISKFADKYIPRDKWWTWDTIKGIELNFGLENGDPTRGFPMVVGDANVHALLAGATGAGKSAAINQMLISLITKYPPSELLLIYIDFKNVEAAKFTQGYKVTEDAWMTDAEQKKLLDNEQYFKRVSKIPHLKIISGTTDGEYALSVFEYLLDEMARRQQIINKFGETKLEDVRKGILKGYNEEHGTPKGTWRDMRKDWAWYKEHVYDPYGDMPRLLVIFDEFQVMFNTEFVPQKTIDAINGKITAFTKLARAMGAHFWFTSQSMKGTMSKDTIGNFSLRGALRCDADVSNELLGNPAASTIKAKFGYMYTNDSAGTNKDANKLWRVPFLDTPPMMKYIEDVNAMLEPNNEQHRMADFYDEKILVPAEEIDTWYRTYDAFNDPDTFILGERAAYSTNKAPLTMSLVNDGGENVMIAAFERSDMLNLVMTIVRNLKLSKDVSIIMNVQDAESHTLLDVENIVEPKFVSLASPKQDIDEFVSALETIVAKRKEKGGPYKSIYVFCIQWERAPLISVDINYKFQDRFKDLLREAPTVGMHFVFGTREKLDMPRFIPMACNHRVCGLIPKDSFFFIEDSRVEKLPDASKGTGLFAIYEFGTAKNKFRIYQHTYTKKLKSRDVVL